MIFRLFNVSFYINEGIENMLRRCEVAMVSAEEVGVPELLNKKQLELIELRKIDQGPATIYLARRNRGPLKPTYLLWVHVAVSQLLESGFVKMGEQVTLTISHTKFRQPIVFILDVTNIEPVWLHLEMTLHRRRDRLKGSFLDLTLQRGTDRPLRQIIDIKQEITQSN